ncbi:hypothetical protein CIG75_12645 [Tumebacillus algifaecis]|uniref:Uncharacterized protein n=1 Tax=Tumebacillus algifaecis TaxID=1214604 RepID=A0A223D2Z3_9BACL|nr:hypothetical protein CIG75_12645 [Tumebacillus algifaecis]
MMTDLLNKVLIGRVKENGRNSEKSSGRLGYTFLLQPIMHFAVAVIANSFANKTANIMCITGRF